ncbi:hypothetical protein CVT25_008487 [Psilocybe cyanescens]|uniref:Uncharacterized protein n=1 Tax=Psilocybe cyanescens TaxID=93625 RepID=A0A409XDT6_PSICY|nr:hypothetical protein CVT25_008487 [Psilocybe cyanescens]
MTWTISLNGKRLHQHSRPPPSGLHLTYFHTSKASTTATAFFDIWDTASVHVQGFSSVDMSLFEELRVGGGAIPLVTAMRLPLNAHAAPVLTSWRSTKPLHLVAKGIQRQTPRRLQCLLGSHALISLAAPTVERIMVPMSTLACSGVTGSMCSGLPRNIVRYERILSHTDPP